MLDRVIWIAMLVIDEGYVEFSLDPDHASPGGSTSWGFRLQSWAITVAVAAAGSDTEHELCVCTLFKVRNCEATTVNRYKTVPHIMQYSTGPYLSCWTGWAGGVANKLVSA